LDRSGSSSLPSLADRHEPVPIDLAWPALTAYALIHLACFAVLWTGAGGAALPVFAVCYAVRLFGLTACYHRYSPTAPSRPRARCSSAWPSWAR